MRLALALVAPAVFVRADPASAAIGVDDALPSIIAPVVGILTQPIVGSDHTYIAASYVKWLEMGGARSVVIPYDATPDLIEQLLPLIDGVLFTGGSSDVPEGVKALWNMIVTDEVATDGEDSVGTVQTKASMPVWGTCLGFEYLLQLAANNYIDILDSGFDASNVSLPLNEVERLLLYRNDQVYDVVTRQNVTMNNHHFGITPEHFASVPDLTRRWQVTSTNTDMKGRKFVSTIEPHDPVAFPVFGVQYHPEKNAFEYAMHPDFPSIPYERINHSLQGIAAVTMEQAVFFVSIVRQHMARRQQIEAQPNAAAVGEKLSDCESSDTTTVTTNLRGADPDTASATPRANMTMLTRPIFMYPIRAGTKFEQTYVIPPANEFMVSSDKRTNNHDVDDLDLDANIDVEVKNTFTDSVDDDKSDSWPCPASFPSSLFCLIRLLFRTKSRA